MRPSSSCLFILAVVAVSPVGAQQRAGIPSPLSATATAVSGTSSVLVTLQRSNDGTTRIYPVLQLRLGGAIVGSATLGTMASGQQRQITVAYTLPPGTSFPANVEIYAGSSHVGTVVVEGAPTKSTVMGRGTSPARPGSVSTTPAAGSLSPSPALTKDTTPAPNPVGPAPTPPAFKVMRIHYLWDFGAGMKIVEATHTLQNQWVLPRVDAPGPVVYIDWQLSPLHTGPSLVALVQGACCFKWVVNGIEHPLQNMPAILGNGSYLRVVTSVKPANQLGGWPNTVAMSFMKNGVRYEGEPAAISAAPESKSYFETFLYPVFQHERCVTCHNLGDGPTIIAEHLKDGIHLNSPEVKPQNSVYCSNCHVTDWRTPAFSQGIVWQGKTARQICTIVNAKLPTASARTHHFHDDPRIEWAVTGKPYPAGCGICTGVKEPAFPAGFVSFLKMVDQWIAAGSPCPAS